MNVLSLCDGISCGQQALKELGIKVDNYFACEINNDSIMVAIDNFPNTQHLGNMLNLTNPKNLKMLPKIDLILSGTPCQGISKAKGDNRKDLEDNRSKLFFDFVEIKNWLIEHNNPNLSYLYENVVPTKETLTIMNEFMEKEPVQINSSLVSAQNRERMYWSNLDAVIPEDKGILINDIIYDDSYKQTKIKEEYHSSIKETKNYIKWDTSGKGYYSQQNRAFYKTGKMGTLPKSGDDKTNIYLGDHKYRKIHPIEAERLQTLPDNYTSVVKSNGKRVGLCGDGWTVEVVKLFLDKLK